MIKKKKKRKEKKMHLTRRTEDLAWPGTQKKKK